LGPELGEFLQARPNKATAYNALVLWNFHCIRCHAVGGEPHWGRKHGRRTETLAAELGIACEACHGPAEEHVAANGNPPRRYRSYGHDEPDETIVQTERRDSKTSYTSGERHLVGVTICR